jgi:thioredoxin reductase
MTEVYGIDHASIDGKALAVAERTGLLVVGAGPAGIAAALEGRRQGLDVVLVDENPVAAETMGDDIPQLFGGAMSGAVRNRTAMTEALLAARPGLEAAFEAGVDVRLGTACWGIYANGPSVGWLPGPVAALSDQGRAWMLGFERAVVATGARDMGIAFPGWDLPGVSGVLAAAALASVGAYAPRRAVLLGTGAEALAAARQLVAAGVAVVAVVEVAAAPVSDVASLGAPVLCGHRVVRAEGGVDGVTGLVVTGPAGERHLACDAVLLGVGAVPVIELLDAAGCRGVFDPARGGWVPVLDGAGRTSLPFLAAAGDCAGVWPAKAADPAVSEAEGRRAAGAPVAPLPEPDGSAALADYRMDWVEALVLESGDTHVCRCEEVTAREILEVRPPRYLDATNWPRNDSSLRAMLGAGPPNPDLVKRLTRAGMGVCQGRRCREQVACLLALGSGEALRDVPAATFRAPVRPLPLRLAHAIEEPAAMRQHWDTWFGMYSQYVPFWDVAPSYTAAGRPRDQEAASE